MHFRDKHSLCEHPDCLSKKFIVFVSEAELKVCFVPSYTLVSAILYAYCALFLESDSCICCHIY